jgi:hypothetical protein
MPGTAAFAGTPLGIRGVYRPSRSCQARRGVFLLASHDPARVNISKYKSQRSILSADKDISPEAINDLLVRAGKPVRDFSET